MPPPKRVKQTDAIFEQLKQVNPQADRSDDTLRICYDLSGKARPSEFKTTKETQLFLVTYQREKP